MSNYSPGAIYGEIKNILYNKPKVIAGVVGFTGLSLLAGSTEVPAEYWKHFIQDLGIIMMIAGPVYSLGASVTERHLRNRTHPRNDQSPDLEARTREPTSD